MVTIFSTCLWSNFPCFISDLNERSLNVHEYTHKIKRLKGKEKKPNTTHSNKTHWKRTAKQRTCKMEGKAKGLGNQGKTTESREKHSIVN